MEEGSRVEFTMTKNEWTVDKRMKAIDIKILSSPDDDSVNTLAGVVSREVGTRGYGFIQGETMTYFFLEASITDGHPINAGDTVEFEALLNHKYNPPKPYATRVRAVKIEPTPAGSTSSSKTHPFRRAASCVENSSDMPLAIINSRALALKNCHPPKRISRMSSLEASSPQSLTNNAIAEGNKDSPSSISPVSVVSVGELSLKLLVEALLKDGKVQYLEIRNILQKPDHFGRALTREEKQAITKILSDHQDKTQKVSPIKRTASRGIRRQYSRSNSKRSSDRRPAHLDSRSEKPPVAATTAAP